MPLRGSYEGETCVAYLDISGFKEFMKKEEKAARVLDKFYTTLFTKTKNFSRSVDGRTSLVRMKSIVVSDCAIIFVDNSRCVSQDRIRDLRIILRFIQKVNRALIMGPNVRIMTTCTIAYGKFKYMRRFEFDDISKEYFVGWPYVKAFLDNESGEPRIQPGECRILQENLHVRIPEDSVFSLLERTDKHYYFYWMLDNPTNITPFKKEYKKAYSALYNRLMDLLQNPGAVLRHSRL